MKIKDKIKEKLISFSYILAWFIIWAIISVTLSYASNWNSGLLWQMLKLDNWVLKFININDAVDTNTLSWAKIQDWTISKEKLDNTLSWVINSKADSTFVNNSLATKLDKNWTISWSQVKDGILQWNVYAETPLPWSSTWVLATTQFVTNALDTLSWALSANSANNHIYTSFVSDACSCTSGSATTVNSTCFIPSDSSISLVTSIWDSSKSCNCIDDSSWSSSKCISNDYLIDFWWTCNSRSNSQWNYTISWTKSSWRTLDQLWTTCSRTSNWGTTHTNIANIGYKCRRSNDSWKVKACLYYK